MNYPVTGATGNIGGRVVERLLALGHRPTLFVRDVLKARARFGERVELRSGELADERSLGAALAGTHALFLASTGPELARYDASAAALAKRAGVARIVKLSALGARGHGRVTAVAEWHARGEDAIRASGVPYVFVQPVGFMSNALEWARSIRTEGIVRASTGEGRIAMIDPDDIAAVATRALTTHAYDGQALQLTGPELLTYSQMVAKISAAIGSPVVFEAISDEQAHANLLRHGLSMPLADALVWLWREVREGLVATRTDTVERVTGQPPSSFDHWAREHAAAFR